MLQNEFVEINGIMVSFLHPGCLREMKFSANRVKRRSNAVQTEGRKPAFI